MGALTLSTRVSLTVCLFISYAGMTKKLEKSSLTVRRSLLITTLGDFGKCTPTDLDWVLEISDKVLIFAEVKRSEKINGLPIGQKILAQNLCRYINPEIIPVYFLYVQGIVEDNQIEIENATVLSFYSNITNKWEERNILFKNAIDLIIKKHC